MTVIGRVQPTEVALRDPDVRCGYDMPDGQGLTGTGPGAHCRICGDTRELGDHCPMYEHCDGCGWDDSGNRVPVLCTTYARGNSRALAAAQGWPPPLFPNPDGS